MPEYTPSRSEAVARTAAATAVVARAPSARSAATPGCRKPSPAELSTTERVAIAVVVIAAVLLRLVEIHHFRIDSDEPQHLHVAWAWTQGLLQYRDVFDNHSPLFHMLFAPVVAWLGERPDIVEQGRLAMLPFYALAVASAYAIGRALFTPRVAAWGTLIGALYSRFFLCSIEFRTDDLWAALWLLALAVLVHGRLTHRRAFAVGVLLGTAVGVSMKTTMLLTALTVAAVVTRVVVRRRPQLTWRALFTRAAVLAAGLAVVPVAIGAYFAWRGALGSLYYGTIAHNTLPGLGMWREPLRTLIIPAALPLLIVGARWIARFAPNRHVGARRVLVYFTAAVILLLLVSVWPLITREDFLPVDPLTALLVTALVLGLPSIVPWGARVPRPLRTGPLVPLIAIVIELFVLVQTEPWQDETRWHRLLIADVLRLTTPADYVMDVKGETVYRHRPFFWGLEHITKERIARGLIPDHIAERLIATRTPVVTGDATSFPNHGRAFMRDNYVVVGEVRVLGQVLPAAETVIASSAHGTARTHPGRIHFRIRVPNEYAIVAEQGEFDGWLDGTRYRGPRLLSEGTHELRVRADMPRLAYVWAPAFEKGYSPFPR